MLTDFFRGELSLSYLDRAAEGIISNGEVLRTILKRNKQRLPKSEGIPALLVLEDFCQEEQVPRLAAPGDEGMGILYALMLAALSAEVMNQNLEDRYPPECSAMSALADHFLRMAHYQEALGTKDE